MENYKKVLIVLNPMAGQKKANAELTNIVNLFTANGYLPTVLTTLRRGDGTKYTKELGADFDLIVAIGGDGSFNEVVTGVMEAGLDKPIGYIPAGSTNDFANSMGLSTDIMKATEDIIDGHPISLDVGDFNGRAFTYVASFGAFTKTSYSTPQNVKNAIGHLAYVLSGINSITDIKPIRLHIQADDKVFDGDYIFGAIANSTSMGGVLKLDSGLVDISDGKFELLLVKKPADLLEVGEIIRAAGQSDFVKSEMFIFMSAKDFKLTLPDKDDWSLDGEYQEGTDQIEIHNHHEAVSVMVND